MDKLLLTKAEAVEKYGSEKCKEHFRKYGKIKSKSVKAALEKTLEQHFEVVGELKQGRSKVYVLEGMKTEPSIKFDGRTFNGNWDNNTMYLDLHCMQQLFDSNVEEYLSYNTWLKLLLIKNEMLNKVMDHRYDNEAFKSLIDELVNLKIIVKSEKQLLNDLLAWFDKLRTTMIASLKRLEKLGIIKIHLQCKAFNLTTNRVEEISEELYSEIMNYKKQLLKEFEMTEWRIRTYRFSTPVRNFNECFDEYLSNVYEVEGETIPIANVFKAYQITLTMNSEKEAIDMYCVAKKESTFSSEQMESIFFKGIEKIEEMKVDFYTKKTNQFLREYFNDIENDAKSNGLEGLEFEFEEWARGLKSKYNVEYVLSHINERYLDRILSFEQDLIHQGLNGDSNYVAS